MREVVNIIMKHCIIKWFQTHNFPAENSYEPKQKQGRRNFSDGELIHDIFYESKYPNGFLDIYKCRRNTVKRPLIIYAHGGGFTWGSKEDGDPNAGKTGGNKHWFFEEFMKAGYDIVSLEYAFAPEYRYPTPVLQMQEAVKYLISHKEDYFLDMDNLIFAAAVRAEILQDNMWRYKQIRAMQKKWE